MTVKIDAGLTFSKNYQQKC